MYRILELLQVLTILSILFYFTHIAHRLGELVVPSITSFDALHHVSRSTPVRKFSTSSNVQYAVFHIPWSKTAHTDGEDIVATKVDDLTNPYDALLHHLSANAAVPADAPLFAFETTEGWSPMTKAWFLTRCNDVWKSSNLPVLSGHCFRIGGATELLLRGVPPDMVATQGRWKSRAFLEYWRRIEAILPIFISGSFNDSRVSLLRSSMDSFARRYQ